MTDEDRPRTFEVENIRGDSFGEGVEFTNGNVVVAWDDSAEDSRPEPYRSLEHLENTTTGLRFVYHDDEQELLTDGGTTHPCAECGSPTVNGECIVASCDGDPDDDDDGAVATDGGREMNTQPAVCPECRLTLDVNGNCRTKGCDGPD